MEKEPLALTKTCSICGEVKALAAFLQMAGTMSTEYGSVCADCRKKGMDKAGIPEADSSTRTSSGAVIDNKSKLQADIDKKERFDATEEEYYKEREAGDIKQTRREEQKDDKAAREKYHRQTFLNHRLLGGKSTPVSNNAAKIQSREQLAQQNLTEATHQQEQSSKDDVQKKEVDQSEGENLGFGLQEKHKGIAFKEGIAFKQGTAFQSFRARLGKDQEKALPSTPSQEIEKNSGPNRKK